MDAFKNYQSLMSGIGQNIAGEAANQKATAIFNAKSRADEIAKSIGEAKVFISGKPLMAKVGKVLKAKFNERSKEYLKKFQEGKPGGDIKEPVEPPEVNAEVTPNDAGPSRLDALKDKIAQREYNVRKAKEKEQAQKDADDSAERRGAKDKDASGEEESFEMKDMGGGSGEGQEIQNKAFDPSEAEGNEISFAGEGEAVGGDIATGLEGGFNAASDPVFTSVMSQTRGGNLQNPFANARQNKFNPQQEDGQSNSAPRSQPAEPETQSTADAPASSSQAGIEAGGGAEEASIGGAGGEDLADSAVAAAKSAAEAAAKKAAEKLAEQAGGKLAGEEGATGILDAIPGADVIGVVVGGILAAVSEHKAHLAEKAEQSLAPASNFTTMSYQAGVGTD